MLDYIQIKLIRQLGDTFYLSKPIWKKVYDKKPKPKRRYQSKKTYSKKMKNKGSTYVTHKTYQLYVADTDMYIVKVDNDDIKRMHSSGLTVLAEKNGFPVYV